MSKSMYKYVQYVSIWCCTLVPRVPVEAECHGMSNHRCLTMLEPCLTCAMLRYASMLSGTIYGPFWSLVFDHSASATGAAWCIICTVYDTLCRRISWIRSCYLSQSSLGLFDDVWRCRAGDISRCRQSFVSFCLVDEAQAFCLGIRGLLPTENREATCCHRCY